MKALAEFLIHFFQPFLKFAEVCVFTSRCCALFCALCTTLKGHQCGLKYEAKRCVENRKRAEEIRLLEPKA